jgi:hypothetical protein
MLKAISQSKLKGWEYCRAGFYMQYVLGLDAYNPNFEGGTEYHKSVELYHRGLESDFRRDRYGNVLLDANNEPVGTDVRDDELIKHYTGACDCTGKLEHPTVAAGEVLTAKDGHPMVEERISIILKHPETGRPLPLPLSMVIDRVVSMKKLDDLKTSKAAWNQNQVDTDIQATLYLYAWWQKFNVLADFGFTVVRKNPGPKTPAVATFTTSRTVQDFAVAWEWANNIITEINEATEYPCTCWDGAHKNIGLLL